MSHETNQRNRHKIKPNEREKSSVRGPGTCLFPATTRKTFQINAVTVTGTIPKHAGAPYTVAGTFLSLSLPLFYFTVALKPSSECTDVAYIKLRAAYR